MDASSRRLLVLASALLLVLGTAGCLATRKYVQTQAVAPLDTRIQGVDKKIDTKTSELDSRITDVDHKAEQGIATATNKADTADQNAQKANQAAQGAQQTADKGVTLANQTQQEIDNIDNYQSVKSETVHFDFNRADLTDEDKQQLDTLTQTLSSLKHYAIAVQGYTDATGPKQYNLDLSRRRADSVVRYLTESEHVPLVKIHVLGFGEDQPAADNKTRDGRKENRRVEVRIMAPQTAQASTPQQQAASGSPTSE